jgi:arylsulfatase A-like enzyme
MAKSKRPNILLIAIDSLRRDRMSLYGFDRLTTPNIDKFAQEATVFEDTFSAHIPTTSAYASMLTGRDCFGTQVVALRHKGGLRTDIPTMAEILRQDAGYVSACVGFGGNPSNRGFDEYLNYEAWGSAADGKAHKAEGLNDVTLPLLDKLSDQDKPWFVMLRHMDPHSPYLPPKPFDRMFYQGDECDPSHTSMQPIWDFKPFADYFRSWIPEDCTDAEYVNAQYDGAVAYMDVCIQQIFERLEHLGILDDTIVVINGDHGETLDEHECYFDHHGMYDPCLVVPLVIRYPKKMPMGWRVSGFNQHKDLGPTLMELAGVKTKTKFDGESLMKLVKGAKPSFDSEFYITECTWMRKHGWRTPQWKLIVALEPDFHFKPEIELYNLIEDPLELTNVAAKHPDVVAMLRGRMDQWIAQREKETGLPNPMHHQGDWSGAGSPHATSQEAYDNLYIGSRTTAQKLQAKDKKKTKKKATK